MVLFAARIQIQCILLVVLSFTTRIQAFSHRNIHEHVINHIAKEAATSKAIEMTLALPVDHFDNKRTIDWYSADVLDLTDSISLFQYLICMPALYIFTHTHTHIYIRSCHDGAMENALLD